MVLLYGMVLQGEFQSFSLWVGEWLTEWVTDVRCMWPRVVSQCSSGALAVL